MDSKEIRNADGSLPDEVNVMVGVPLGMAMGMRIAVEVAIVSTEVTLQAIAEKDGVTAEVIKDALEKLALFHRLRRSLRSMVKEAQQAQADADAALAVERAKEPRPQESN